MKFIGLVVAVILLLPILVIAQTNPTTGEDVVTQQTANETQTMMTSLGAKVRMLQMEKVIEKNMLFGQMVIDKISQENTSYDTTDLDALIEELQLLKDEVSETDTTQNASEVVKHFVDFKNDAIEITYIFRNIVQSQFTVTEMEQLRAQIMNNISSELTGINQRIRNAIREYNAERVMTMLQLMSSQSNQLMQGVENGSMNAQEIREQLQAMLQQMNATKKNQSLNMISMNMSATSSQADSATNEAKLDYTVRRQERLQERLQNMTGTISMIQDRMNVSISLGSENNGNQGGSQ